MYGFFDHCVSPSLGDELHEDKNYLSVPDCIPVSNRAPAVCRVGSFCGMKTLKQNMQSELVRPPEIRTVSSSSQAF